MNLSMKWPCHLNLRPWPSWPLTFSYDLDLDLCDIDLDPHNLDLGAPFLILGWKLDFFTFFYLVDLWPANLTFKLVASLTLTLSLWPTTLTLVTFDIHLWPWPWPLSLWPDPHDLDLRAPFLELGWKLKFLHFWPCWPLTCEFDLQTCHNSDLDTVTLTYDFDLVTLWPLTFTYDLDLCNLTFTLLTFHCIYGVPFRYSMTVLLYYYKFGTVASIPDFCTWSLLSICFCILIAESETRYKSSDQSMCVKIKL